MDLAAHFRIVAQNWLRTLLISLAIAAIVFVISDTRPRTYRATELLGVQVGDLSGGVSQAQADTFAAQTYAEYVTTPGVINDAIRMAKIPGLTRSKATDRISAKAVQDVGFVQIKATGPSRQEAERLGRAAGAALINAANAQTALGTEANATQLQGQIASLRAQQRTLNPNSDQYRQIQGSIDSLSSALSSVLATRGNVVAVLSGALSSTHPVAPRPMRDALLAFLVSLVVVSELTVLVYYVGDRFSRTEDSAEVTKLTGLPVIAKVPRGSGIELVEAFRVLRTNLMVLEGSGKPRTLAVVSANQGAGKSFTALNLAESAAGLEERIVLVDADLRKPVLHDRLGIARTPGLSSVLQGGDLTTALQKAPDTPFLRVLASGKPVDDASGVLGARAFRHVLDSLRAVRLVIVDTPPAGLFADAMAVASQCDATIFVLDVQTSRRRQVRQTLEALDRAGANMVGVVVNRTTTPKRAAYYQS
ncbi:MAG TPA: polysaccharide biosynthesis tyrosine autokinase [Acidimicrobiia bacterium]|jgi:capsular exopolysaccharide synthesis family protein